MFTQEQLDEIKFAAKRTKNQGELAVVNFLNDREDHFGAWWNDTQWDIINYCAEECKRQRSGEMSVYDMVNAWNYAHTIHRYVPNTLDTSLIAVIGSVVEPNDNRSGFRKVSVWVGSNEKEKAEFIQKDLDTILFLYYQGTLKDYPNLNFGSDNSPLWDAESAGPLSAEAWFYYYYETIHPFIDGNGRSGKILYNYLLGTLENPVMPPNFWGGNP